MWSRIIELLFAVWLFCSHYVFPYPFVSKFFWINDLCSAALIASFALLSFVRRFEKAHLCSLAVALWLMGVGFFGSSILPPPAFLQNDLIVGLLLLAFAIIPSHSSNPPKSWAEFYKKNS
jgi:hypothetical protein